MFRMKLLLTVILFLSLFQGEAQLPVCSSNHIIYTMTLSGIYNIDLSQPLPTPVLNTIPLPPGAAGLAVSNNLNAASPALTFYTVVNGVYRYYDGNSWVNTNDSAGTGVNIGGGGGYIYNFSADGTVTRYDGRGDAIPVATLPGFGSVADLSVDCAGNFYHLHNAIPQTLTKYSPSGVALKVYTVTGAPVFSGGGGLVVSGNEAYYDDLSSSFTFPPLLHGTIRGDTINFVPSGFSIALAGDMASCAGSLVSSTPFNVSICSNQLPFNWNGQNYNTQGTYTTTLTASNGCDSIVTLNLSIHPTPPIPLVTSQVNYCQFQTTQPLSATATGNLLWYTAALGGIGSSTTPVPSTIDAGITNFFVSQSIGGCESPRTMITVNVFEAPALGPDKTITICHEASINLNGLYNTAGSTANWFLNQAPVTDPALVSIAGRYQLMATIASGCADTAFVNLVIEPAVIAFAGNDDSTESLVPYQLSGSGGLQYEWSPGPPLLNNATIPNPVAILTANTSFSLIVTDAIGCKGYDTVTINVFKGSDIYVPSAFTPNGDGRNDMLHPLGRSIERLDYFRIYNRYGELIFETNNLSKGWDGTYKGKDQNTGNYIWVLKALDRKKIIRTMKGNVILIR